MAETVEDILGYSFKERSFLLQALTHASYTSNELSESYERLEFLGDAVLDYLVTAHIFASSCEDANPGQMTDCRSALVNNNLLAALVVNANLHPFLLHHSPELMQKVGNLARYSQCLLVQVTSFVDAWKESGQDIENIFGLINEDEAVSQVKDYARPLITHIIQGELVEVPKVLGDLLESILGAIFLDSGHSLSAVWKVFRFNQHHHGPSS